MPRNRRLRNQNFGSTYSSLAAPWLETHSATNFAPCPVAPILSSQTGPAISMWAKGFSLSTKFCKNRAAVMAPPYGVPRFEISAILLSSCSLYSFAIGILHILSPDTLEEASKSFARSSLSVHMPAICFPNEIIHAPVRVDNSMMLSHPTSLSAKTKASARVRRPSASVFLTSIVMPLEAVKTSLGTIALSLTIFSQAATIK
mmetsp:Transcript_3565/g.4277  ORF Transcript_3565/g.4277 Transcript_3565/m.4277 type:complete len:202 (-) Transcript_3565:437-1042(-)